MFQKAFRESTLESDSFRLGTHFGALFGILFQQQVIGGTLFENTFCIAFWNAFWEARPLQIQVTSIPKSIPKSVPKKCSKKCSAKRSVGMLFGTLFWSEGPRGTLLEHSLEYFSTLRQNQNAFPHAFQECFWSAFRNTKQSDPPLPFLSHWDLVTLLLTL